MDVQSGVLSVLDQALNLEGRAASFTADTPLLGALPELDSMAVVSLITALEQHFGIRFDDDDIDGSSFASVGKLSALVSAKVGA